MAEKKTLEKRPDYHKQQSAIEAKVAQAKEEKNRVNIILREKAQKLIDEKIKYNRFKLRKFKSAFKLYSESTRSFGIADREINERIIDLLNQIRDFDGMNQVVQVVSQFSPIPDGKEN